MLQQWWRLQHQSATHRSINMMGIVRLCDGIWTPVAHVIKPVAPITPQTIAVAQAFDKIELAGTLIITTTIDDQLFDKINDVHLQRPQQRYLSHQQLVAIKRLVLLESVEGIIINNLIGPVTQIHQTAIRILINNAKVKVQTVAIPRQSVLSIKFQIALCNNFYRIMLVSIIVYHTRTKSFNYCTNVYN